MVGLERSVLPLVGKEEFGLTSTCRDPRLRRCVRRREGVHEPRRRRARGPAWAASGCSSRAGWSRCPCRCLSALAPSWWWIVAANMLLGVNQGLAWSMTVVMKIDLAGPARRGLALGLNESAGYLGVAVSAFATGALAASFAPRTVVWVGAALIVTVGLVASVVFVSRHGRARAARVAGSGRDSQSGRGPRRAVRRRVCAATSFRDPVLRACSQAGLVNNLNDALAWGLAPLYLAAHGASRPRDRDRRRRLSARLGRSASLRPAGSLTLSAASR